LTNYRMCTRSIRKSDSFVSTSLI